MHAVRYSVLHVVENRKTNCQFRASQVFVKIIQELKGKDIFLSLAHEEIFNHKLNLDHIK